jgi:intein-encoded DNA endonuclease-like protein
MPIHKTYNQDFFKKWSVDMAYVLGFLYADGNIIKTKRGTHFVSLQVMDKEIVYKIRDVMESNHKINQYKKLSTGNIAYRLQIGSKELFTDLTNIGLVVNKTKRIRLPKIPENYETDFIRGYFDGDGGVWTGIRRDRKKMTQILQVVFTSSSFLFLKDLKSLLKRKGLLGGSLFRVKSNTYSRLLFGTGDSLKLYKTVYNGRYKLFLNRKKLVFERFIEKYAAVAQR